MMRIPFSYIWRSLWARRLTTALTVGGVALVVFVFAGVLMLARGLEATLVETGSADNVIVLRRSATSELSSQIDRATADAPEAENGVARAGDGRALLSRDVMLIINLYKKKSGALGNVSTRGVSAHALEVRHGVRIIQGRPFQFGTHEIEVGKSIASRFKGVTLGAELAFAGDRWTIVGTMYAGVASRAGDVGTVRGLGRRRRSVLAAVLVESVVLALRGGGMRVALAAVLSFARISGPILQSSSWLPLRLSLPPGVAENPL